MIAPTGAPALGAVAVDTTLGIIAGGRATRLGGLDKAWLRRDDVPQVLRLSRQFASRISRVLVSANRALPRYAQAGLRAVPDRHEDIGPLGGLDALAHACVTPWLLTLPVDVLEASDCLPDMLATAATAGLAGAGAQGAWVEDDAGVQPLVALWPVATLRAGLAEAIAARDHSVQALQRRLCMPSIRLSGVRLGNLNTLQDLQAAGVEAG